MLILLAFTCALACEGANGQVKPLAWKPVATPRYLYGFTSDAFPAASGINDTAEFAATPDGASNFLTQGMVSAPGIPLSAPARALEPSLPRS